MKKQRTAGAKGRVRGGRRHARSFRTGLAFLAAGLLLFSSGCGASKEAEPESLEPEHIVSVTVVNASDTAVTAILIDWSDTLGAELYDVLETAGIEELKPDDVTTVAVPELDEPREITVWNPEYEDIYNEELLECLQDGDILVLTPEYTNTKVVYGGETGVETAKALALQAYEEELFARRSAQAEEERVQESDEAAAEEEEEITKKAEEEEGAEEEEEVEEAEKAGVEALGYESLEQMRRYNHTVYDIEKAYFVKLTGYWYPEKDRNSRTYLVVDEQDVMRWFTFQEGKGDVETAFQRVSSAKGNHYRLSDGRSFTMKESMRENTLQFDGEETVYYWDGY